jgi:hypothetical protein
VLPPARPGEERSKVWLWKQNYLIALDPCGAGCPGMDDSGKTHEIQRSLIGAALDAATIRSPILVM